MGQIYPESTFDEKVSFLSSMAVTTARNCPILPIPIPQSPAGPPRELDELSLTNTEPRIGVTSAREEREDWTLEFDSS